MSDIALNWDQKRLLIIARDRHECQKCGVEVSERKYDGAYEVYKEMQAAIRGDDGPSESWG